MLPGLPQRVQQAVQIALAAVRAHPDHALSAANRQHLYAVVGSTSDDEGHLVRAWLAILAAQRVLRVAQDVVPTEAALPARELELALRVVKGAVAANSPEVVAYTSPGFFALTRHMLENPMFSAVFTLRVNGAFRAAHLALLEACGTRGLEGLDKYRKRLPNGQWLRGVDLSDKDVMFQGASDAAAPAAVAEAWDQQLDACAPAALKGFWEWWLSEALPRAWALAESTLDS